MVSKHHKTIRAIFLFMAMLAGSNLSFGQEETDRAASLISELKTELNNKGITDFFVVKRYTHGAAYFYDSTRADSCSSGRYYFTLYAFWKNGSDSYVQKFDNCGAYNTIQLPDSRAIDLFRTNSKKLESEKVKRYQTKPDSIGRDGLIYKSVRTVTHQPERDFWFFTKSTEFKKHFNTFDLITEEDGPNLNYKSNNELILVQLNAVCEEIIDELDEKNMFHREE